MFNEYPYVNLQDVNLDWILKHIKDLETNLQDFVKLNTIKYADPIIWNITKQYETNTVVIDGNTGTAYLSVQPVPAGVGLTNTDYWTPIFTLNLLTANQNITFRDDGTNVIASFASDTGDWLLWNFYLYRVTQPISINTAYVEGFNIERFSVELFIRDYINILSTIIGDLDDLTTSDKTNIVNAINNLQNQISVLRNRIYDISDYEMVSGENIYDKLYDLLQIVNNDGGGIVYFPNGTYYVDYTIFIPDNTVFLGESLESEICFTNSPDTYMGCVVCNGGSNVTISNMSINTNITSDYPVIGALPNAIGITDIDFNSISGKRVHEDPRKMQSNITIINVNCNNSNYGIQIEPGTYNVEDIFISNHVCRNGMCSVMSTVNTQIKNVYFNNIICDTFRCGIGYYGEVNINVNGLYCTQLLSKGDINLDNFYINSSAGNRTAGSQNEDTCMVLNGLYCNVSNGYITKAADSLQVRLINAFDVPVGETRKIILNNIHVENPSLFPGNIGDVVGTSISYSNVNFDPYLYWSSHPVNLAEQTSSCPAEIVLNADKNKSSIKGWFALLSGDFGTSGIVQIGRLNADACTSSEVPKTACGIGYLIKAGSPTPAPALVGVLLDTNGYVSVYHFNNDSSEYNSIYIDLTF